MRTLSTVVIAIILAAGGLCLLLVLRRQKQEGEPEERRMLAEGAAMKAEEVRERHDVKVGEPVTMSGPEFLAMLEEQAAVSPGEDADGGHCLTITMYAPVQPMERFERFEEPLAEALGEIGEIHGGGTMTRKVDGESVIESCNIEVIVEDVETGLAIIRKSLKEAGAPRKTTITQYDPEPRVHQLYE